MAQGETSKFTCDLQIQKSIYSTIYCILMVSQISQIVATQKAQNRQWRPQHETTVRRIHKISQLPYQRKTKIGYIT